MDLIWIIKEINMKNMTHQLRNKIQEYIKSKIDCLTKELKKIEERLKKITDE